MTSITRSNWAQRFRTVLGLALLAMGFGPHAAAQGVSISSGGTASYAMPIGVPPGISGMAPNLSLLYGGGELNGPVGLGWSLQGISSITRCPSSKQTDGVVRSVAYTPNDKLCLDGQRLIQVSSDGSVINDAVVNPGFDNPFQTNDSLGGEGLVREYRTEKDIYARIRAYGKAGGDANNGPAYFKVWTKSGQIFEYGINANTTSQAQITATGTSVVTAWPVSRISDTVGNYINFFYWSREVAWGSGIATAAPGKEWNVNEIHYTGHGSTIPVNKILFEYEERSDLAGAARDGAEAYHLGGKNISLTRLKAVRTFINWPADQSNRPASAIKVKTFKIAYDQGPTSGRSRVKSISECGGEAETSCLPAATFSYSDGGGVAYVANANFGRSGLAPTTLRDLSGKYGVLIGNFYNSGRTDILRWSDDPSQNQLFRSVGDGTFAQASNFNITDQNLNKSDACYEATAADFDGDGATDILRVMKSNMPATGTSCGAVNHVLYHSNGDGTFTARAITGIDLTRITARRTDHYVCSDNLQASNTVASAKKAALPTKPGATVEVLSQRNGVAQPAANPCTGDMEYVGSSQTAGQTFLLIDTNADGLLDIIVTAMPAYPTSATTPSDADLCASLVCTHVYLGQPDGSFVEKTNSNIAHRSLYVGPGATTQSARTLLYIGDMNGDGLSDLVVDSGTWYSRGNGDFDRGAGFTNNCGHIIDFNGDGNNDCFNAFGGGDPSISQSLMVSDGNQGSHITSNFNLTGADDGLFGYPANNPTIPNMDFVAMDMDGDGRGDVLRWADDPSKNAIFLSNGDGTFRRSNFNLGGEQLQKSDGTASFLVADFTGHGNAEILRFKTNADNSGVVNALFTKTDPTPPDQLSAVVGPTGLVTQLRWVPLSNAQAGYQDPRYYHDFNTPSRAKYPIRDLVSPMQVVATVTSDTGVNGQKLSSEYLYAGLKASWSGVPLGFREVRQQMQTPVDGKYITTLNEYLQDGYNTGLALLTRTWIGDLWGTSGTPADIISETWNIYCDKTSAAGAEDTAYTTGSCIPGSKVRRPYLYVTSELGWDKGKALPSVLTYNTYDNDGNTLSITSTTQGTALDQQQKFKKTTTNTYFAANKADDNWILGRLQRSTVAGDNRSTAGQQSVASLVRARASALKAGATTRSAAADSAQSDLGSIGVVYARDVVASVKSSGGETVKLASLATVAGNAPYASATQGTVFNLKVTPNPLKVFATAAGKASGTLTAALTGGTPPYSYNWTQVEGTRTSISSSTIANPVISATLALGDNLTEIWRISATDSAGASTSLNVPVVFGLPAATLTAKFTPTTLTLAQNDPGLASGILAPIVTGGITPYTYAWTRTTGTRSALSDISVASPGISATLVAGDAFSETWKVTVTDAAGKTAVASIATSFSAPAVLKITPPVNRTVTVGTTGTAATTLTSTVSGGKSPYTYDWVRTSGTLSTVATATVLSPVISATLTAGQNVIETWSVTVTDSVGHTATGSTDITFNYPPAAMALHFTPASLALTANDPGLVTGQITSVPTGGVQPYAYAWTHTTGTRSSLSDVAGSNPVISATLASGDSFSEQWKLTVTDARGSIIAASITTSFKAAATLVVTPAAARTVTIGTSNTASTVMTPSVAGGVAPYTYSWQRTVGSVSTTTNPAAASVSVSATLLPGQSAVETWTLTVTDAAGHTASGDTVVTFNNPGTALGLSFSPTSPRSDAADPGLVSVQVTGVPTGGIQPFTYAWTHGTGTRTVVSNASIVNPVVSATLGVGETVAEQWKLTVTDAVGKTITGTSTVTLTTPAAMALTLTAARTATATAATSGLATTAAVTMTTTGGRSPYTYSWSRIAGSRSTASNAAIVATQFSAQLDLGETMSETWRVTVTDSVGHTQSADTVVTFTYPASALSLAFTPTTPRTDAPDPGLISVLVAGAPKGGIPPYSYAWTHVTGTRTTVSDAASASTTIGATLAAGETVSEQWRLTVTDAAAKTVSGAVTATLTAPAVLAVPLADTKTITASSTTAGVASAAVTSTATGGRSPYTYSWTRVSGSRSTATSPTTATTGLSATVALGETIVETWRETATDSVGHVTSADIAVTFTYPAPAMAMSFAPTSLSIALNDPGVGSGTATGNVTGGIPPYSYSWAHTTGTRSQISNAAANAPVFSASVDQGDAFTDTWTLTATDTAGKTVSRAISVAFSALATLQPTLVESKIVTITATSGLGSTTMPVTVSGGKAPYTYSWLRTAGGTASISSSTVATPTLSATLSQGQTLTESWQVTVRDAVGHVATDSTSITFTYPFAALTVKAAPTSLALTTVTAGTLSGAVSITATGGVAPYSYNWTHTVGTASQILSGADASVVIGATLSGPAYIAEQWKVDVTDSRGAKGSTLVPTTFNLPGMAVNCTDDDPGSFHCYIQNTGGAALASIGVTSTNPAMGIVPTVVTTCGVGSSFCGPVRFAVNTRGHTTGTITFTSGALKVTHPYDVTFP